MCRTDFVPPLLNLGEEKRGGEGRRRGERRREGGGGGGRKDEELEWEVVVAALSLSPHVGVHEV